MWWLSNWKRDKNEDQNRERRLKRRRTPINVILNFVIIIYSLNNENDVWFQVEMERTVMKNYPPVRLIFQFVWASEKRLRNVTDKATGERLSMKINFKYSR